MATAATTSTAPLEERIDALDGLKLFVRSWRPAAPPRAVVLIVHGFNSHSGHYLWVGAELMRQGFAVYALDLRGRGRSDGDRYFVERYSDYVGDIRQLLALAKAREHGLPIFVLGHSAGGVLSCVFTLENQSELAGLICEISPTRFPRPSLHWP